MSEQPKIDFNTFIREQNEESEKYVGFSKLQAMLLDMLRIGAKSGTLAEDQANMLVELENKYKSWRNDKPVNRVINIVRNVIGKK